MKQPFGRQTIVNNSSMGKCLSTEAGAAEVLDDGEPSRTYILQKGEHISKYLDLGDDEVLGATTPTTLSLAFSSASRQPVEGGHCLSHVHESR